MSERLEVIRRIVRAIGEPDPPPGLRERTLARAAAGWARPAPDPWRRVWGSGPLRLAWAVAVAVLAVANVAVRTTLKPGVRVAARPTLAPAARGGGELQAIVALPRIRAEYLGTDGGPPAPAPKAPGPRKHHGSEDKS